MKEGIAPVVQGSKKQGQCFVMNSREEGGGGGAAMERRRRRIQELRR